MVLNIQKEREGKTREELEEREGKGRKEACVGRTSIVTYFIVMIDRWVIVTEHVGYSNGECLAGGGWNQSALLL